MLSAAALKQATPASVGVGSLDLDEALNLKVVPPNPNLALEGFVKTKDGVTAFDTAWAGAASRDGSTSASASWASASWSSASWASASWASASWASAAITDNALGDGDGEG